MADSELKCRTCSSTLTYNEMTDPFGLELECPVCDYEEPEQEGCSFFDDCFGDSVPPRKPGPPVRDITTYQFPIVKQPFPKSTVR